MNFISIALIAILCIDCFEADRVKSL